MQFSLFCMHWLNIRNRINGFYHSDIGGYTNKLPIRRHFLFNLNLLIWSITSSPFLKHLSHAAISFYYDWTIQLATAIKYYIDCLASAIFFVGMSFYVGAMVEELKLVMDEHDGLKSNTAKYRQFLDGITLHWQIFRSDKRIVWIDSIYRAYIYL